MFNYILKYFLIFLSIFILSPVCGMESEANRNLTKFEEAKQRKVISEEEQLGIVKELLQEGRNADPNLLQLVIKKSHLCGRQLSMTM